MSQLFLKIVNMSISAGWLVLAVLILRLVLKKAPKWVNVLLWGIVALRLLCPVSIESALSLIPSAETIPEKVLYGPSFRVQTGIALVDDRVNDYLGDRYFEGISVAAHNGRETIAILAVLWIVGIAVLLVYTAISCLRLRRQVGTAVRLRDNIFQSENVASPFVFGLCKPKIYLPFQVAEQDIGHVIAHEQAHIRRRDHWWKPFGFLLLTVYWFNPLMWLAYMVLCRDIELACDEKVIRELGVEQRADYSQALLACSVNRRMIAACPLAFGEVGVKKRVKSVLKYKKPAFWIAVSAVAVCVTVAVCFLTNPIVAGADTAAFGHVYRVEKVLYSSPQYSLDYEEESELRYTITTDYGLFVSDDFVGWFLGTKLSSSAFDNYFVHYDDMFGWQDGNRSPESIRRNTKQAWCLDVEDSETQDFYYLILTKRNDVYLAYGYETEDQAQGRILCWMVQLTRDSLSCFAVSDGWSSHIQPGKYPEGTDWTEKEIGEGVINGSGVLQFIPDWDTETLVVREEYYRDYGDGVINVERATYELPRDPDGQFTLEVARRGERQEEAVYSIEGHEGIYIMKIIYATPEFLESKLPLAPEFAGSELPAASLEEAGPAEVLNNKEVSEKRIVDLLDEIQSSPAASSIAEDYITEHEEAYQELLGYGEYTLRYCFGEFLKGGQTDLRGYIMAEVCEDICNNWGEALLADPAPATGQEWFEMFRNNAERLAEQYDAGNLEKIWPASRLLLQMMEEHAM